jgi:hypothetical protein
MSNDTVKPRMSPAELTEACYAAAATATISYVLGYGYVDAVVNDDGFGWPTRSSDVETAPWPIGDDPGPTGDGEPDRDTAYRDIATMYEAAGLASRKHRGLGSHAVTLIGDSMGRAMLDDPKIWGAIEALAAFLELGGPDSAQGDDGVHCAMAMHDDEPAGIKFLTDTGLTPTYWADQGEAAWMARYEASIAKMVEDGRAAGYGPIA